jgi:ParB-like chromosome segregation protein Spo0J
VGLLQPVVVNPEGRLIAGQRRLQACKLLGWIEVDVHVVTGLDDARALLAAERDENTCRKDMTASELYALGKALEELERPKAAERQGARTDLYPTSGSGEPKVERTREAVGEGMGISGGQWQRLRHVGDLAEQGPVDVDPWWEVPYLAYLAARRLGREEELYGALTAPEVVATRLAFTPRPAGA